MEYYLPDYLTPLLTNPTLQTLRSHAENWSSWPSSFTTLRTNYLDPYLLTPLTRLLASSTPDFVSVLLLLLLLIISLKVLDYARRVVMFWVMLAVRVAVWGTVLAAGCYVYSVGLEKAGRDLGWLVGVLWGFGEEVWGGFQQHGQQQRTGATGPGGYGGGYGYRREGGNGYAGRGRGKGR